MHYLFGPQPGRAAAVCEVATGFFRLYLFHHTDATPRRLSGNRDVEAAFAYLRDSASRASGSSARSCMVRLRASTALTSGSSDPPGTASFSSATRRANRRGAYDRRGVANPSRS